MDIDITSSLFRRSDELISESMDVKYKKEWLALGEHYEKLLYDLKSAAQNKELVVVESIAAEIENVQERRYLLFNMGMPKEYRIR